MKVEVAPDISVIIALSAVIFDICAESYVILDPDISVITPESAVKFVNVEESAFTDYSQENYLIGSDRINTELKSDIHKR